MATSISFDSNSLQTSSIQTASIGHSSIPQKEISSASLAHANKSLITLVNYPAKIIRVSGKLVASSISAMDTLEDTFKGYFNTIEGNLDIGHGGSTRRYVATANMVDVDRPGGLAYANFALEFLCTIPFGLDTSTTTALNATSRTLNNYTDSYTFLGNAPIQQPIFTYTLNSVTGGTAASVILGNADTGQQMTIIRNWTAADVLVVNVRTKTVTINGVEIIGDGAFPDFKPGARDIEYSDTFTTRNFNINVIYTKMYL